MPNRSYQEAAAFENHVLDVLRRDGYDGIRAAGSLGKADMVAWKSTGAILVMQAKTVRSRRAKRRATMPGPAERVEVVRLARNFPCEAVPLVVLYNADMPDRIEWVELLGDGSRPGDRAPYSLDFATRTNMEG